MGAIKIPGAAEVGIGRKTPGAIREGAPRPVTKIRTGMGLEVAQAVTGLAGQALKIYEATQIKAEKVRYDEARNNALNTYTDLKGGLIAGSRAIEADSNLDYPGKDQAQKKLLDKTEAYFRDNISEEFQSDLSVDLRRTVVKDKLDYQEARAVQIKDKRVADMEITLDKIGTFSFEYPGNEKAAKETAHINIDTSPLSETDKIKRKKMVDAVIDTNAVKNELALGDPEVLLTKLQEKTEAGNYANYKGMSSVNRIAFTKQARDAVSVNRGLKIANDLYESDGPETWVDHIDLEAMVAKAEKRAGTKESRDAAVTRLNERSILHNKARTARINSNQTTIWEAHDNGAKSAAIEKMVEFVELPAENRLAIRDKLRIISERGNITDQAALRAGQRARFNELSNNSALLRELGPDGLIDEERAKKIAGSEYTTLKKMLDEGSLEATRSKKAFGMIADAENDELFDKDNSANNLKGSAAAEDDLHDFILTNPKGDAIGFVNELLDPLERNTVEKLMDVFYPGQPGTEAFELRKAAKEATLRGEEPGVKSERIPIVHPPQGAVLIDRSTADGAPVYKLPDGRLWTP